MRQNRDMPDQRDFAGLAIRAAARFRTEGRFAEAETLYKRALAIREKALAPDHPDVATGLNNLAALYVDQGRYAEAEPLYKRALAIWEKALGPDHPDVATGLNNLAVLYGHQGRYSAAEPFSRRALAIWEKALGPDHPDVATGLNNVAVLYGHQGRYDEAEPLYIRALAIREKVLGPDHPDVANSLNSLAGLYGRQGRYDEAEPLYIRALKIREDALGPDHPDVANSLDNLAGFYGAQLRYSKAEPLYRRALAVSEKALGSDHPDVATRLNNLAAFHQAQGHRAEPEPLYRRALAVSEKALGPDHPDVADSLARLAVLYQRQWRYTEALAASARSVKIFAKRLALNSSQRSRDTDAERRVVRPYFTTHIALADIATDDEPNRRAEMALETFEVAQIAHASRTAQAIAGTAARFAIGSDALAAVVREHQDLTDRWRFLDSEIIKALSRTPDERNPANEASLRGSLEDVARQLDALDTRIANDFPAYAELVNPQPVSADAVQDHLAPDEALLVYLCSPQNTWLWVVRRNAVFFARIDIAGGALSAEVSGLRARLDPELNPDFQAFPARRAYELYQRILSPAAPFLAGADHLIIVPDGALQSLPFGVPVTRDPAMPADYRGIAWLARDHAITALPSVSALRSLRRDAAVSRATAPFFGIGDPLLRGHPQGERGSNPASLLRGKFVDVERIRELPPLPDTAEELRQIARVMGATENELLLRERACEPMIRRTALDRYKVVAFATHGLISGELVGLAEPALVLTPPVEATSEDDGLLTASKIAGLKLDADWVVLSACNTAAGDGTPDADGLTGLAKAFFHAGARALLVSHWRVNSEAAARLTTGAFTELAQDPSIGPAEALRRSMMRMLDTPLFSHPQMWATFVVAGGCGGTTRASTSGPP
jgi:CHAT domain-containing protein/Tfp pilus assembly protein PilF